MTVVTLSHHLKKDEMANSGYVGNHKYLPKAFQTISHEENIRKIFTRKDNVFPVNPMGTMTGKYTLFINSPEMNT